MMLTDDEIEALYISEEDDRVERKASAHDSVKIRDAICAYSNDMPDHRKPGIVIVGQNDDLTCAGLPIDDDLLLKLSNLCTSGSITPVPSTSVRRATIGGGQVAIIIVSPSENPPVRHNGAIRIRVGPRRALATPEQERRLIEKRRWGNAPYDLHGVNRASIDDLDTRRFRSEYLPTLVSRETLSQSERSLEQELSALRITNADAMPTVAGVLLLANDPRAFFPGAFILWRRVDGENVTDGTLDEKEVSGTLIDQARRIEEIIDGVNGQNLRLGEVVHERRQLIAKRSIQQMVRNAIIHRNYEATNTPIRITWFSDRVEIISPGGVYGTVTRENIGTPGISDYRNPTIAEAFKSHGYVERFGFGIHLAGRALEENGNPPCQINIEDTYVAVTMRFQS